MTVFKPAIETRYRTYNPWYKNSECDTNWKNDHGGRWWFMGVPSAKKIEPQRQ
jgi:hypothetical protein